ncbi:MAG TPA: hypothetical protein VM659_11360 [Dongiaceae bacterium]|nr:hypothetical protein [Dongiaceae bacterium]
MSWACVHAAGTSYHMFGGKEAVGPEMGSKEHSSVGITTATVILDRKPRKLGRREKVLPGGIGHHPSITPDGEKS